MGSIKKQSIQNTIISYVGMVLGYANTILLIPNVLQPDEVGLTKLMIQISVLFANLSALGFPNMAFKFFPYFRNKAARHHGFLFFLLTVPLAGFAIITGLYVFFKPFVVRHFAGKDAGLLLEYYYHIIILSFFTLFFVLQDAYLKSLYKTVVSSFIQDFLLRLLITLSVTIYALNLVSFQTFVYLFIFVNSVTALVLTAYIIFLRQFFVRPTWQALSIKPLNELLTYGLFSFVGNISVNIIMIVDSLMILSYRSMAEVGIYQTATLVTSSILIPARSVYKTVMPKVADYWAEYDMVSLKGLYQRVTSVNLTIGTLIFIGIWANVDNIFSLMPVEYSQGKYVLFFMGIARLFDMATGINGIILLSSPKYRYDLIFNILLAVSLIISNYIFIPVYGIMGAAFASMLTVFAFNGIRLGFVLVLYKIQPFVRKSLLILAIGVVTYLISSALPYLGNTFLDVAGRSGLISAIYAALILGLNASPDASQLWAGFKKRFIN